MAIVPLYDRVAIRRDEAIQPKTASGLLLPGSTAIIPNTGVVVAIGPGKPLDNGDILPMVVKVGDRVTFGGYSAANVLSVDGEELLVINESDLIAVLS